MNLSTLLQPWIAVSAQDTISGLQNDSRNIHPGDLFFAYPGQHTDGRFYMQQALNAGATAVIYEPDNWPKDCLLPSHQCLPLSNLIEKMPEMASRFYGHPSRNMYVTGVTGTNGKTTIAYQLAQAHLFLGQQAAYIGTLGQGIPSALATSTNTTPDALSLQKCLYHYRENNISQVCMEVSSHALVQHRVDAVEFNQAIFTNLTLDHLDYHQTMANYADAKALLFSKQTLDCAIINEDDPYAAQMTSSIPSHCQRINYGCHRAAEVKALHWQMSLSGTEIEIQSPWGLQTINIKNIGIFNIYNTLAIYASLLVQGYDMTDVGHAMHYLHPAPGRMHIVAEEPCVIVDYAHTPDALKNVLQTLCGIKHNNIYVVFGCGGDRDKTKRPLMGSIAAQYADHIILTNDNPRSENASAIIEDIVRGIPSDASLHLQPDRAEAIDYALRSAGREDIILIAGKGHENYQQIGETKFPFSDELIVKEKKSYV